MKDNDWLYKQLMGEFNIDWHVCRTIMETAARLIKLDIESDLTWGCIMVPWVGKFDTKKCVKNTTHPDNDLIVTSKGIQTIVDARRRSRKNKKRIPK
jgi:hypothetical protein